MQNDPSSRVTTRRLDSQIAPLPAIAICGLARNAGFDLESSLKKIERLCAIASRSEVIIVTNDNSDGTDEVLQSWTEAAAGRTLVNLDGATAAIPDRIDRLAFARNAYLLALRALPRNPTVIIVMDLDGPNSDLDPYDVLHAISQAPADWGAIFANQSGAYYDLYALRSKGWVEDDVWFEVERQLAWMRRPAARILNRLMQRRLTAIVERCVLKRTVHDRQFHIQAEQPILKVESAFGGLGIYRSEAISNAWYGSRNNIGQITCEHVIFNQQVTENGYGLYVCPSLLNRTQIEHLGVTSGLPFPKGLIR